MRWLWRIRRWWGGDLRRRLLLTNALVILLFMILLGYLSYRVGQTGVREEVIQRNNQLAVLVAEDINSQLDNMFNNVRLFTYQLESTNDMPPLQARAMLEFRRASPLTYRALYLYDAAGNQLIHVTEPLDELLKIKNVNVLLDRPPVPVNEQVIEAYKMAQSVSIFMTGLSLTQPDWIPITYMGAPLVVDQRGTGKVVVAEIDLRDIWRRVDEIQIGQTGHVYVVSQDGTIIAHPDRAYVGDSLPAELNRVLEGDRGQAQYVDARDGQEKYASFSPVGRRSGWGVVVEQDSAEALQGVNRITSATIAMLICAMALSIPLTILTARSVVLPIRRLVESTERIADTGNLEHRVDIEATGEVGQLAAAFNQMILRLRRAQSQVMQLNRDLERRVEMRTKELQESEVRYRAIVEDQTELIWRALPDGTLSFANDAFCRYFDLRWEELVGRNFLLFVADEDTNLVEQAILTRSASNPVKCIDFRVERGDAQTRWHRCTLRAIVDSQGAVTQIQGVGRDVTDELRAQTALREAKETAEAANRAKDEFLASMSHELRTPLNAILGLAEALQDEVYGSLTEKQAKSLTTIESSGRHLLSLINDILDVSRIEADSLRLELANVSVMEVCQASLNLIRQVAVKKNIQVAFDANQTLGKIYADQRRLVQVLVNLMSNAVKFTDEGGRMGLEVTQADDGAVVCFTVWDTGIGMSEPDIRKLFHPFVQLDSGLSRRYGGTGLGLLLAYRLTEKHGGSIGVESLPGIGSRFSVWLPSAGQSEGEKDDEALPPSVDGMRMEKIDETAAVDGKIGVAGDDIRLLVVDRVPGGRRDLSRSLKTWGYNVMVTYDTAAFSSLVREWRPKLVMIDAQVEGDVLNALSLIRSDAQREAIPIVVCTSLTIAGRRGNAASGGDQRLFAPAGDLATI